MTPGQAAEAYWLKPLRVEEMVPIATEWVAAGSTVDAVIEVACLSERSDPRDIRATFVTALEALGVWLPTSKIALQSVLARLAGDLVDGRSNVEVMVRRVTSAAHLDELTPGGIGEPYREFIRSCWVHGSDLAGEDDGDVERAARAVAELSS